MKPISSAAQSMVRRIKRSHAKVRIARLIAVQQQLRWYAVLKETQHSIRVMRSQ